MLPLTEMGDSGAPGASVAGADGMEPGSWDSGGDPRAHAAEPRIRKIPSAETKRSRRFMAFLLD